jgi:hypothetical protein
VISHNRGPPSSFSSAHEKPQLAQIGIETPRLAHPRHVAQKAIVTFQGYRRL